MGTWFYYFIQSVIYVLQFVGRIHRGKKMMKTDCNKVTESKYDNSDERQSSHLQVPSNTSPLKLFLKRSSDMNCRLSEKINLQSIHVYQVDEGNIVNEDVCLW